MVLLIYIVPLPNPVMSIFIWLVRRLGLILLPGMPGVSDLAFEPGLNLKTKNQVSSLPGTGKKQGTKSPGKKAKPSPLP